jgi:hypothetical protein
VDALYWWTGVIVWLSFAMLALYMALYPLICAISFNIFVAAAAHRQGVFGKLKWRKLPASIIRDWRMFSQEGVSEIRTAQAAWYGPFNWSFYDDE